MVSLSPLRKSSSGMCSDLQNHLGCGGRAGIRPGRVGERREGEGEETGARDDGGKILDDMDDAYLLIGFHLVLDDYRVSLVLLHLWMSQ